MSISFLDYKIRYIIIMKDYSDEIITYVKNQNIDTFMEGNELKEYIVEQLIRDYNTYVNSIQDLRTHVTDEQFKYLNTPYGQKQLNTIIDKRLHKWTEEWIQTQLSKEKSYRTKETTELKKKKKESKKKKKKKKEKKTRRTRKIHPLP